MLDRLPPELLECVCKTYAAQDGVFPLCALRQTCKATRAVASLSLLWQSHYHTRWSRYVPEREASRLRKYASDYCQMYTSRAQLDRIASDLLDDLIHDRASRSTRASQFAFELGRDVWDYLASQARLRDGVLLLDPRDSYSRRYWAQQALGVIARSETIARASQKPIYGCLTLEHAVTDISAFWGIDIREIEDQYAALASSCRLWLEERNVLLPDAPNFRPQQFCISVCEWMQSEGFESASGTDYSLLMNHFAHTFLTTHRRTLPMSLIVVFLAVTSRLGLNASPIGYPGQVIVRVHIVADEMSDDDFYVDVYAAGVPNSQGPIVDYTMLLDRLALLGIAPINRDRYLQPSSTATMVQRITNNIVNSLHAAFPAQQSQQDRTTSSYVAACLGALVSPRTGNRTVEQLVESGARDNFPLDTRPVIQRGVGRTLFPDDRHRLELLCEARVQDASIPVKPTMRTSRILYAVGQIVFHRRYHYWGVIYAWNHECTATEAWISLMDVDKLPGGRHQPFYHVFALLDDSQPERYVASHNIVPLHTCPKETDCPICPPGVYPRSPPPLLWDLVRDIMHANPHLGRHFTRVESGQTGRARFVPSPELDGAYPEDDRFASSAINDLPPPLAMSKTSR